MRYFVASESLVSVTSRGLKRGLPVKRTGTRQPGGRRHAVSLEDRDFTVCQLPVEDLNEFRGRDFEAEPVEHRCPTCDEGRL
jgi:hypothetical protein